VKGDSLTDHKKDSEILERVTPARRQFVRDLMSGGFAIPAMVSFSMATIQVATLGAGVPHGS
jgi:hypothetical protein